MKQIALYLFMNNKFMSITSNIYAIMKKRIFYLFTAIFIFSSCADDYDDLLKPPSDFYYVGSMPIPFYTNGNSGMPNIDWGNDIGTYSLNAAYVGVGVDAQTGVLSWNENLPIGGNDIQVTATNSFGSAVTNVLFLHQFSGQFIGGYNTNPSSTTITTSNLDITFNVNETMSITDDGTSVNGTWSFVADELICLYSIAAVDYELKFDLTYSVTVNPFLEGYKKVVGSNSNSGFARLDYQ